MAVKHNCLLLTLLLSLWIAGCGSTGAAGTTTDTDNPMTPMDVASVEMAGNVTISPDGSHIVYTKSIPANPLEDNETRSSELHILDTDTEESTALYTETGVGNINFRPEHGTITFTTTMEDEESNALYQLPVEGGEPEKLFQFDTSILGYRWHDDGDHIVFMANEPLDEAESKLPYEPDIYEEGLANRKGYITNVTHDDHDPHRLQVDGSIYKAEWSPDGDQIAISVAPTPHIDDRYMYQTVKVIDYDTREVAHEIDNEGKIAQIRWSPDGENLALRAGNDLHDPIDGRIMIVSSEGGTPQNIYPQFEGKFEHIEWTSDNEIHFIASESTERTFGRIDPDGSGYTRIIHQEALVLNSFSFADDGTAAFQVNTPAHPNEVYLWDGRRDNLPERMTVSNDWLENKSLGEQRVITYEARDGAFEIEGLLVLPLGYEEGDEVPLIVEVHGGPEAHYENGWLTNYSMPGHLGAARGFATFYPNYRGSTGRGLEFITSSQGDLAGREFDDIVDGVDYLIDEGIVDEDRVGVTGGSYGGYATAWMSTYYSDRFAAGVMFVGISNNLSKWGTSDIPEELYLVHSRERVYNNWDKYLENSPIFHVDNAQTPLLIMHGAEDTRVHPGQSLELYRHIKVRRPYVPLRLVWYPGEGHGNARATSQLDYNLRMLRWFESFLIEDADEKPEHHLDLDAKGITAD